MRRKVSTRRSMNRRNRNGRSPVLCHSSTKQTCIFRHDSVHHLQCDKIKSQNNLVLSGCCIEVRTCCNVSLFLHFAKLLLAPCKISKQTIKTFVETCQAKRSMSVGGMSLWLNTHTYTHAHKQNSVIKGQISALLQQDGAGLGRQRQMGLMGKYCCYPIWNTTRVYVCKNSVLSKWTGVRCCCAQWKRTFKDLCLPLIKGLWGERQTREREPKGVDDKPSEIWGISAWVNEWVNEPLSPSHASNYILTGSL